GCDDRPDHHGTTPWRSTNRPSRVSARQAARIASVPSSTDWVPEKPLNAVAVYPGSTATTRTSGNALAYINVTMLRAAFDDVYTRPGRVDSIRCGSEVTANDPMPLDTITS